MGLSDKDFTQLRDKAAALDARRQRQIDNQIDSLNRLLKGGTYDSEMAALHQQLAATQQAHRDLKDHAASELRGLADSLDESVIANEEQRLAVYDALVKLRTEVLASSDAV